MEYYSAFKKNEIILFVVTWMDLEIIMLSEAGQIWYYLCVESKKNATNELIYKTEIDLQT